MIWRKAASLRLTLPLHCQERELAEELLHQVGLYKQPLYVTNDGAAGLKWKGVVSFIESQKE